MTAGRVRVVDRGASKLLRDVKAAGATVEVGVVGQEGEKPATGHPEVTVAQVAEWMEYGVPGRIPARSWLRAWIDENGPAIEARVQTETRAVIEGKRTKAQALARVGVWAVGEIQKRIAAGIDPPNADSTIARKGSSVPLIDTGQLRSSITSRVVD